MISEEVTINFKGGLHARPAAMLVKLAQKFVSDIYLRRGTVKVKGKSILEVMLLGATRGSKIIIEIDGEDETEARAELLDFFENALKEAR